MPAQPLMNELGMTEAQIKRRLEIVDFGPLDKKRVLALRQVVIPHSEEYTAAFFGYLSALEEANGLMSQSATLGAARRLKNDHLKAMVGGDYGPAYVEERLKLGMIFARGGLDPRVFLGAYHHLMRAIGLRVMEQFKDSPIEGFDNFMSFKKLAFFDLSLIVDVIVYERERIIRVQQEAIRELSTPVLQVHDRLLILPIIGGLDRERAQQLTEGLLSAIRVHRARVVIMDVTGVPDVDAAVANHLVQTVLAARLIGAHTVVSGMSAQVAEALITHGVDVSPLNPVGDLRSAIEQGERLLGYNVTHSADRRGERR